MVAKSTVDITWDKETVEDIERTPFYAMLKSNPYEKITGTIYLSNGQAPSEEEQNKTQVQRKSLNLKKLKTSWKICTRQVLHRKTLYMTYLYLEILITTQVQLISAICQTEEILKAFEEKTKTVKMLTTKITQKHCQIQKQKQQKIQLIKQIKLRI